MPIAALIKISYSSSLNGTISEFRRLFATFVASLICWIFSNQIVNSSPQNRANVLTGSSAD